MLMFVLKREAYINFINITIKYKDTLTKIHMAHYNHVIISSGQIIRIL